MAKPYRDVPLPIIDEDAGLPILKTRTQKAAELLKRMCARFSDDFILHAAQEIGLDECCAYAERDSALTFDLTALQLVALSSALAALAEYRDGKKKERN